MADARHLPYPDQSMDRVVARHMLYHLTDPGEAIAEMHRVLRHSGLCLALVNDEESLPGLMGVIKDAVDAAGVTSPELKGGGSIPAHRVPASGGAREAVVAHIRRAVTRWFAPHPGPWRNPKGCSIALGHSG